MGKIRVAVCESYSELKVGSKEWKTLAASVSKAKPDVFLLNELPFGVWISAGSSFEADAWSASCLQHETGIQRLGDLGSATVLGTRARELDGRRVNEAFVWTELLGAVGAHTKQFFPDEEGYFEARWFEAGEKHFNIVDAGALRIGFLICTEVMFNEWARYYGRLGAQAIVVPRAVGPDSMRRWLVAMKMAAIVSGCYVLSSNRYGTDSRGQEFGGQGWVIDPNGELILQTTNDKRFLYCDLNTDQVTQAQREFPCYVKELSSSC